MRVNDHGIWGGEVALKERVLILCVGNSARSQMAEGLLRTMAGKRFDVYSAGIEPSVVHPLAIQAMSERGIDLSGHRSKHMNEFLGQPFDVVITVCQEAAEACPIFPGRHLVIHWSFPDPAKATGTEAERMAVFREVRDAIEARLQLWLNSLDPTRKG